jgi:hypothetical protein
MELVQVQANAVRLSLWTVPLPWPCSNEVHEEPMRVIVERARAEGIRVFLFGDPHVYNIRAYRER